MIPNYPVEHSGEGQFQASNLCCNHRGNHTYNNAVEFTSQQQKARESKTIGLVQSKEERQFCGEIETNLQNLYFIIHNII